MKRKISILIAAAVALPLILNACSQKPAEIHYGSDECAYCRMMITDSRFASQIVTGTGKAITFDAIECMADYTEENKSDLESAKMWVSDFNNPGNWIEVQNAKIVQSEVVKSPMGESLLAFENEDEMNEHLSEYPGKPVDWQSIVK
ncbi:MAG: nitrous oxide reductase accessory protein NosL [Balneolaceae bacterium]|nr:nitrous oxide reductase accessory protein NosL [Balneolaceae bacterium]